MPFKAPRLGRGRGRRSQRQALHAGNIRSARPMLGRVVHEGKRGRGIMKCPVWKMELRWAAGRTRKYLGRAEGMLRLLTAPMGGGRYIYKG